MYNKMSCQGGVGVSDVATTMAEAHLTKYKLEKLFFNF